MRKLVPLLVAAAAACTNQPFTLDVPLRVVATTPSSGALGVARKAADGSPAPIVTFVSEELDPASVTAQSVFLTTADGTAVATKDPVFSVGADGRFLITLVPSQRLAYSQQYQVTMTTDLRRLRDAGRMPTTVKVLFTTEDPPALGIVFAKPSDGGAAVTGPTPETERSPVMKVRFTEPVDCATVTAANVAVVETFDAHPHTDAVPSRTVPGTWKCNSPAASNADRLEGTDCLKDTNPEDPLSECVITFQPTDPAPVLSWSSRLSVALKGGAASAKPLQSVRATAVGGQLPATVSERSAVIDPPALALASVLPAASATGVARTSVVELDFSEPVDCAQLKAVATIEELRDPHAHIPAPTTPETGTKTRLLWPGSGSWACPDVSAISPIDHSCGAAGERCRVVYTPAKDTNNAAELGADAQPLEYSSIVRVTLPGGAYATGAQLTARKSVESVRATSRGGELASTVSYSFRTEDPPPFAVQGISPADGAHGVQRNAFVLLQFSEPVDCAHLLANALVLEQRDAHHHVPTPAELAAGTVTTRQLWPQAGPAAGGVWTCPASAGPNFAQFTPLPDPAGANNAGADDGKALAYSSLVSVALNGGTYASHTTAPASYVVESARATTWSGTLAAPALFRFYTEDPPALALSGTSPGNGATNVGRSPAIKLAFSEPPDCATLQSSLVVTTTSQIDPHPRLASKTSPHTIAGAWTCPAPAAAALTACAPGTPSDPCVATFTPAASELPFDASTLVDVAMTGGAYAPGGPVPSSTLLESLRATSRGGELATSSLLEFRIEDPLPQVVLQTSPANQSTNVAVSPAPSIEVDLSQPVACATMNTSTVSSSVTLADGTAGSYSFTFACTPGSKKIFLMPATASTPLPYSATFAVTLRGGAFGQNSPASYPNDNLESTDATTRGGQLPADYSFSFKTQDPPPMLVKATTPSGSGTGVALAAPIDVSFTQPLDCSSVTASTFSAQQTFAALEDPAQVVPAPAPVACSFTCPLNGNPASVRCDHAAFAQSSTIAVTLQGGGTSATSIRSQAATAAGGFLPSPAVSFSFRAADPLPLVLTANTPDGNPGANVSANTDVRLTFNRAVRCATAAGRVTLADVTSGTPVAVAGSLACSDGNNVGPAVNGALVIFTPSAALTVDHTYQATVAAGVEALDATNVGGTVYGRFPQPASFNFVVAHQDLRVVSTTPAGGSTAVTVGTNLAVRFNQDISVTSLVPCTTGGGPTGCNFWINLGSTPVQANAIPLKYIGYDNTTYTATFQPTDPANAPNLQANKTYAVELLSGSAGVVGANGVSQLPVAYAWTFTTSSNQLVLSTVPQDTATGLDVSTPVCVEFANNVVPSSLTAGGNNQIVLTYQDAFGRTAQVPLDPATPYTLTGTRGFTQNYVCLNLVASTSPSYPGPRRLLYGAQYVGLVSTSVTVGTQQLAAPFAWGFTTRTPPQVAGTLKKNSVINEALSAGDSEVPVNAAFVVQFAETMNPATLTASNISVVALGGATAVTESLSLDNPSNPHAVTVTLSGAGMDHAASYALQLLGGVGGVTTQAGDYLGADVSLAFATSPVTSVTVSPAESAISPDVLIPVVASRDLYLPSANANSVYANLNGAAPLSGNVAEQPQQLRAVTYIAEPTWSSGVSGYVIHTTAAMLDYRGNPVPAVSSQSYSSGNTPSLSSQGPATATSANLSPAPGPTANGSQSFVFTLAGTGLKNRMIATTYYATAPGSANDGTVALVASGGAGCPASGTRLPLRVSYQPGTTVTSDAVRIDVLGPPYMQSGCGYALQIHQAATANLYMLAPATVGCGGSTPPTDIISSAVCLSGAASPGVLYTGETTPPTLSTLQVQDATGATIVASGATNVLGASTIVATFSEAIDPATAGKNATLASTGGSIPLSASVSGSVVTYTPAQKLAAGQTYTFTLGAVADLAGNPYAGSVATFTAETGTPTFASVAWDPTATRSAPYGTATLAFSEAIDPATLTVNQASAAGSVSPSTAGPVALFGTATRDPANPAHVLWRPASVLSSGATVTVAVNAPGVATKLANTAGTAVTAASKTFTP